MFFNVVLLLIGFAIMWIASGFVISGIERFSKDSKVSTFTASFLILGILTSITEISVGLNAVLEKTPDIFVGNLLGGAFVIIAFIIPVVAIAHNGANFSRYLTTRTLLYFVALMIAPIAVVWNGTINAYEGVILIALYLGFVYAMPRKHGSNIVMHSVSRSLKSIVVDFIRIIIGAVMLFYASKILIHEVSYFAEILSVPSLLLSLFMLSIGTNLPELFIAAQSIRVRHTEIALGDYIGSASANTLLFGIFTMMHGTFTIDLSSFKLISFILLFGFILFWVLSRTGKKITSREGMALIGVFAIFIVVQLFEIIFLSLR